MSHAQELVQRGQQLPVRGACRPGPGHDDKVKALLDRRKQRPASLSQAASCPITASRLAHLLTRDKAKTRRPLAAASNVQHGERQREGPASGVSVRKIPLEQKPLLTRQHRPGSVALDGEPLAALKAARAQHVAAILSMHPLPEPVHTLVASVLGLVSSLHSADLRYSVGVSIAHVGPPSLGPA